MNEMRERIERLEQASQAAEQAREAAERASRNVERRARHWQLVAGLLVGLGLIVVPLRSGTAQGQGVGNLAAQVTALQARVVALESLLAHFSRDGNEVYITGANLHLRNGLGATDTTNTLGNLIVGYNEPAPPFFGYRRTGSHNLVVGKQHGWESFGGFVAGELNRITGPAASVSGGAGNTASGPAASVGGGLSNSASSSYASVSGGAGVTQAFPGGWAAGSEGALIIGHFSSP